MLTFRADRYAAALAVAAILGLALLVLNRSVIRGEVLSASDLLFSYPPWRDVYGARPASNHEQSDETLLTRPTVLTHWARLARGEFPAHDPTQLAGVPAFMYGLLIGRTVYPPALVYFLASPARADGLFALIQLSIAGLFMYAYCRRVGLGPWPATGAAMAFMLNGYFAVWLLTPKLSTAIWLPAGLLAAEHAIDRPGPRAGAMIGLAVAPMYLGSYLPNAIIGAAIVLVYWMTGAIHRKARPAGALWVALGMLAGAAIGAVSVLPAGANLASGELQHRLAAAQSYRLANLATFVFPEFWGAPAMGYWWAPASNYSESVTYLGIVPLLLAPIGALWGADWRRWFFAALACVVLCNVYGLPGFQAGASLPVLRSIDNRRFVVALALSASVLTGMGLDALSRSTPVHRRRMASAAAAFAAIWLGIYAAASLTAAVPRDYRLIDLWGGVRGAAYLLTALAIVAGTRVVDRGIAAAGLVALLAVDLTVASLRLVPTVPPSMAYPPTPGLEWLRAHQGDGRIAFVGDPPVGLVPGEVPGVYGLRSVGGYDFLPDSRYQRFLGTAMVSPPVEPRMGYVYFDPSLEPTSPVLDLLHVRYIATPPDVDLYRRRPVLAATQWSRTVGELLDGRQVGRSFACPEAGLSQIDLYVATYQRPKHGRLVFHLRSEPGDDDLVTREFPLETLRDNGRVAIAFPALPDSAGRRYRFWLESPGARTGNAVTLWANDDGAPAFRVYVDRGDRRGLREVYAGDLNIIENLDARPAAWIVRDAIGSRDPDTGVSGEVSLERPRPEVLIARATLTEPGVLVFSEKFDRRWRAKVDGRSQDLLRVNDVLCGVRLASGAHRVELMYSHPLVAESALVGAAGLLLVSILFFVPGSRPD